MKEDLMKKMILCALVGFSCVSFAAGTSTTTSTPTRKPSQVESQPVYVEGPAAENIMHAILDSADNATDLCETHSCHLTVTCDMHREGEASGSNHRCKIQRTIEK